MKVFVIVPSGQTVVISVEKKTIHNVINQICSDWNLGDAEMWDLRKKVGKQVLDRRLLVEFCALENDSPLEMISRTRKDKPWNVSVCIQLPDGNRIKTEVLSDITLWNLFLKMETENPGAQLTIRQENNEFLIPCISYMGKQISCELEDYHVLTLDSIGFINSSLITMHFRQSGVFAPDAPKPKPKIVKKEIVKEILDQIILVAPSETVPEPENESWDLTPAEAMFYYSQGLQKINDRLNAEVVSKRKQKQEPVSCRIKVKFSDEYSLQFRMMCNQDVSEIYAIVHSVMKQVPNDFFLYTAMPNIQKLPPSGTLRELGFVPAIMLQCSQTTEPTTQLIIDSVLRTEKASRPSSAKSQKTSAKINNWVKKVFKK